MLLHPSKPMSVEEITANLPGHLYADVEAACIRLRSEGKLGRNGADTESSPFRYCRKH